MAKTRSKDNTAPNIDKIQAEINRLKVSKADPKRLNELQKLMDFFNFGIR